MYIIDSDNKFQYNNMYIISLQVPSLTPLHKFQSKCLVAHTKLDNTLRVAAEIGGHILQKRIQKCRWQITNLHG